MKKLSLLLLVIFLAGAGRVLSDVKGNSAELLVVSLNAPDTAEKPNSLDDEDEEEEKIYYVEACSNNFYGEQYSVCFCVGDPDHEATSVEITGPGITGSLSLDYDNNENEWNLFAKEDKLVYFGSSPPSPPLTYTFTIVDPSTTTVKTYTVESFVSVYATDLSPSGGQIVTDPLVFSWTGVGPGYTYSVELNDVSGNRVWNADDLTTTSVAYDGPALTCGAEYFYWVVVEDEYGNSSFADESFVYMVTAECCQYALAGDLNDDCKVDFLDFALMAMNWLIDCNQTPEDPACVPK
ncbi:hypothetical protein KA005_65610 [bacterium]|nr:hypothetical protein [bacterium]